MFMLSFDNLGRENAANRETIKFKIENWTSCEANKAPRYIYIMSSIAGQTTGPNWLKFF